jgi:benzoylformate decarboxylase
MARCLGCPSIKVAAYDELIATLDQVMPRLAQRQEPLLLDVAIAP